MQFIFLFLFLPVFLFAQGADSAPGNTSFLLTSAALVMIMVPAVGLFYGGLVRSKNVLNTIIISFAILCVISIEWVLIGYTLVYGPDFYHLIGSLDFMGLSGIAKETGSANIPTLAYIAFQGMFAAFTPAIINGSVVERVRFPAILLFTLLWALIVYNPIAHWVWGTGGFLKQIGALDFAGGTVVHISSGFAALAACLFVGKRKGLAPQVFPSHNLTISVIGAMLLWFGWFGFNPGNALAANFISANAFLTTNTAAAAGAMGWVLLEWLYMKKPSALGILSGAIVGLVVITPAAGYVGVFSALIMGFIGGICCYSFSVAKVKIFNYDDSLDVFAVHGIGGIVGAILTGVFASSQINPSIADGLLYGNPRQVLIQIAATIITALFSFTISMILLNIVDKITPVRAASREESIGLDLAQHGESSYHF